MRPSASIDNKVPDHYNKILANSKLKYMEHIPAHNAEPTEPKVEPMGSASNKPKKQKKLAHETQLHQYRVTVLTVIAGISFLLGAGIMSLVLNYIEDITIYSDQVVVNNGSSRTNANAFTFLADYLAKEKENVPLFIDDMEVINTCTSVSSLEVFSISEVELTADGRVIDNVYSPSKGYITEGQSPKIFEVEAVIECDDAEGNTVSNLAVGRIEVTEEDSGFSITSKQNTSEEVEVDPTTGTFLEGEAPTDVDPEDLAAQ